MKNRKEFERSTLEDKALEQLFESKNEILDILSEEGDGENNFKDLIKNLYICLPNIDLTGHQYAMNFMVELQDNNNPERIYVVYALQERLESVLNIASINIYLEKEIEEKSKSEFVAESGKQHAMAILYTRIPLKDIDFKTNQELNDAFQKKFDMWQGQQSQLELSKQPSKQPKVVKQASNPLENPR